MRLTDITVREIFLSKSVSVDIEFSVQHCEAYPFTHVGGIKSHINTETKRNFFVHRTARL